MVFKKAECINELRKLCMKYDPNGRPSYERWKLGSMRYFYPVQIYVTKVLLTLGFSSLSTTFLWCFVGLIVSTFLGVGSFLFAYLACLLLYLQIVLDGCDGEIARYNRRLITPEEDFQFFVRGIYYDECCHLICNPARLMGLAYGMFLQTQRIEFILSGIAIAYLILFRMGASFGAAYTINKLAHKLPSSLHSTQEKRDNSPPKETLFERILQKGFVYYVNGKHLLFVLIFLTSVDLISSIMTNGRYSTLARGSFVLIGPVILLLGVRLEMMRKYNWNELHKSLLGLHKKICSK